MDAHAMDTSDKMRGEPEDQAGQDDDGGLMGDGHGQRQEHGESGDVAQRVHGMGGS